MMRILCGTLPAQAERKKEKIRAKLHHRSQSLQFKKTIPEQFPSTDKTMNMAGGVVAIIFVLFILHHTENRYEM